MVGTALSSTGLTTLLTAAGSSVCIIGSIIVSNTHGSTTSTITVSATDTSGAAAFNIVTLKSYAAGVSTELLTRPLILENLDILKAQATDANIFDVIVSYLDRDRT